MDPTSFAPRAWAAVFTGQGAQRVGMSIELIHFSRAAARVFKEANTSFIRAQRKVPEAHKKDLAQRSLSNFCEFGPKFTLQRTAIAQPVMIASSIAAYRHIVQEKQCPSTRPACFLGHSIGMISALCAAGSISLSDAIELAFRRGVAMQAAPPKGHYVMVAIRASLEEAQDACASIDKSVGCVQVAAINSYDQIILSGHQKAVDAAVDSLTPAPESKRVHARHLQVSAPFHCRLMAPAVDALQIALKNIEIRAPRSPVLCNVVGDVLPNDPEIIRERLLKQLVEPVNWRACVEHALQVLKVRDFVVMPIDNLSSSIERISKHLSVHDAHCMVFA